MEDVTLFTEVGDAAARRAYGTYLRPYLMELLTAFGVDVLFHRAEGDRLFYRDTTGREVEVLDLVGGFGASLFGHNHPELVAIAQDTLTNRRPFNAQASVRGQAGLVAERLAERVGRFTGRSYVTTLANSGAEAVEAAIKHAQLERSRRADAALNALGERFREVRLRLRDGTAYLPEDFLARGSARLAAPIASVNDLFAALASAAEAVFEREPLFLGIEGGFHGKTTGALKLTHNTAFREPWQGLGIRSAFLPREDLSAPMREVARARATYVDLELAPDGEVTFCERSVVNIGACFAEPVQGEGGIHELSPAFLRALRAAADEGAFPLVFDEIQCGMGRCGTFLASEPSGVRADYYLLSKALGGGLAKIAALLVDRERFLPEFSYLHSSTFADDDPSSAIALGALDLIERDRETVIRMCHAKGQLWLERLRQLGDNYPDVIRAVRGRGLMLGIEMAPQADSPSPLLRVLWEQHLLGYVAAGYLLKVHGIRVGPTLSAHATVRIEPSAFVSDEALDQFCRALAGLLEVLRNGDVLSLVGYLVGRSEERVGSREENEVSSPMPPSAAVAPRTSDQVTQVAFLVHFVEPTDLRSWEPRLRAFSAEECERFLSRTSGMLRPFVMDTTEVRSATGCRVAVRFIAVPFTPEQALSSLRAGSDWALHLVRQGVDLARSFGCSIVGLGGYTSIVTDDCRALIEDELALTSGNSLAVAAAYEALRQAARRVGIPLERAQLGVVGGIGNLGAVLAELAAEEVRGLLLVGRPAAALMLRAAARELYRSTLMRIVRGDTHSGIASTIAHTETVRETLANGAVGDVGAILERGLANELGDAAPIRIATELEALRDCDLILSATNAARPVVHSAHIGDRPVVICDIAVPRDVDAAVTRDRPLATVIRGGMVRAPLGQTVSVAGMRLTPGELYGCLAETILLGFERHRSHYSYGKLTAGRVRQIRTWADRHGFEILEAAVEDGSGFAERRTQP